MAKTVIAATAPPPAPLDEQVKRLLDARKGTWKSVARDTGVSYSWITKFMQGHIDNPGFATLQRLAEHLSGEVAA